MIKEQLNRFCTRIILSDGKNTISKGSGTIIFSGGKYYVFTAYHCVYGENGIYNNIDLSNIIVETQEAFNTSFIRHTVNAIVASCQESDWALLAIDLPVCELPDVVNVSNFRIDTPAYFRGFQKRIGNEGRTFDCIVKEPHSMNEFKVTLGVGEQFNQETENAKGLSGSGVFIIQNEKLHLIGALKSVKGMDAINDDILCCSITVLEDLLPDSFTTLHDAKLDIVAADEYNDLSRTDARNLSDKILAVCPEINLRRIKTYCSNIVLGNAELANYDERAISSMKSGYFEHVRKNLWIILKKEKVLN